MNLNKKDVRIQAVQFLSHFSKFKDAKLDEVFRFWVQSKDFDKKTERAIRREADRIIRQRNA